MDWTAGNYFYYNYNDKFGAAIMTRKIVNIHVESITEKQQQKVTTVDS